VNVECNTTSSYVETCVENLPPAVEAAMLILSHGVKLMWDFCPQTLVPLAVNVSITCEATQDERTTTRTSRVASDIDVITTF